MITVEQLNELRDQNKDIVGFRQDGGVQGTGKYKRHVLVCAGTGCTSSGSLKIADELEKEIKEKGLAEDVCVIRTGCTDFVH
ncbi:hypothetical protein P261_02889 [Lachnospiraceae bacterium TWA4]|nr:hypothetical protein P261_02889 [Lachnospiraceae bacterium TWA4]